MLYSDTLIHRLYLALKAFPCRCAYERNTKGVPLWSPVDGGVGIERRLISKCSRCTATEEYETLFPERISPEDSTHA